MQIKKLELYNWRNINNVSLDLSPHITFVRGPNGAGKTNLLEAIWYLAYARSFRKLPDSNLIRKGEKESSINGIFTEDNEFVRDISIKLRSSNKRVEVDNKKINTLSSYIGTILISAFEPKKVFFFKNEPGERRRVMDETLSAIYPEYLYSLSRYKKLLKERNKLIYQNGDGDMIQVLTNELIKFSYQIVIHRKELIDYLNDKADMYFKKLFKDSDKLRFEYKTNTCESSSFNSYKEKMLTTFSERKSYEMIRRTTLIGPHCDDMVGYLNDLPLSNYASQGQNRLASLSIVLALKDLMQERKNKIPILILDDVLSDLDEIKQKKVCETIRSCGQVILTGNQNETYSDFDYIDIIDGTIQNKGEK